MHLTDSQFAHKSFTVIIYMQINEIKNKTKSNHAC